MWRLDRRPDSASTPRNAIPGKADVDCTFSHGDDTLPTFGSQTGDLAGRDDTHRRARVATPRPCSQGVFGAQSVSFPPTRSSRTAPSRFRLTTTAVMAPRAPKGNNPAPESSSEGVAERALLRTGARMPLLGLGTWKIPTDQCPTLVREAISRGWRHIDCACDYGNEREVGAGIASALASGVRERDLWVTSKLWNTYHRQEHVRDACKRTLDDLGLDYLDLYLIHFPISLAFVPFETRYPPEWVHDPNAPNEADRVMVYDPVPVAETWRAMEALVDEGLVKNIGVCNFNVSLLTDLLAGARVPRGAPDRVAPLPRPATPQILRRESRRARHSLLAAGFRGLRRDGMDQTHGGRHQRTVRRGGGEGARRHPGAGAPPMGGAARHERDSEDDQTRASVGEHRRLRRVVSTHPGGDGRHRRARPQPQVQRPGRVL